MAIYALALTRLVPLLRLADNSLRNAPIVKSLRRSIEVFLFSLLPVPVRLPPARLLLAEVDLAFP